MKCPKCNSKDIKQFDVKDLYITHEPGERKCNSCGYQAHWLYFTDEKDLTKEQQQEALLNYSYFC